MAALDASGPPFLRTAPRPSRLGHRPVPSRHRVRGASGGLRPAEPCWPYRVRCRSRETLAVGAARTESDVSLAVCPRTMRSPGRPRPWVVILSPLAVPFVVHLCRASRLVAFLVTVHRARRVRARCALHAPSGSVSRSCVGVGKRSGGEPAALGSGSPETQHVRSLASLDVCRNACSRAGSHVAISLQCDNRSTATNIGHVMWSAGGMQ